MEIILKSILGGLLIGAVLLLSKVFGPKFGGVVATIPLAFMLSFLFVTMDEKAADSIQEFLTGGVWGIGIFLIFLGSLLLLMKLFPNHYWINVGLSYGIWFLCTAGWFYFSFRSR